MDWSEVLVLALLDASRYGLVGASGASAARRFSVLDWSVLLVLGLLRASRALLLVGGAEVGCRFCSWQFNCLVVLLLMVDGHCLESLPILRRRSTRSGSTVRCNFLPILVESLSGEHRLQHGWARPS